MCTQHVIANVIMRLLLYVSKSSTALALQGVRPPTCLNCGSGYRTPYSNGMRIPRLTCPHSSSQLSVTIQLISINMQTNSTVYEKIHFYHLQVWHGNALHHVRLSFDLESSYLVRRFIFRISRSSSYIKVTGSRSR